MSTKSKCLLWSGHLAPVNIGQSVTNADIGDEDV